MMSKDWVTGQGGEYRSGWYKPYQARKYHYLDDEKKSLCGKWSMMFATNLNTVPDDNLPQEFRCKACEKKLAREKHDAMACPSPQLG